MKVLVIAPHPDDEVLGVGGTIIKRVAQGHEVFVCIVTRGSAPLFTAESVEQVREECKAANALLGTKRLFFLPHPAAMVEDVPRHVLNASLARVIEEVAPDEIYLPHEGDMQLDHRLIAEAAMVCLRPRTEGQALRIYAYETLSETGWSRQTSGTAFIPNVYEDITDHLERKLEAAALYASQMGGFPVARSVEALRALAILRGATVCARAAEAFCLIRETKI